MQEQRWLLVVRDPGERLASMSARVVHDLRDHADVEVVGVVGTDQIPSSDTFDFVVAMGGDGTILRSCRQLGRHQRPMIGVNMGRLGFLADLTPEEFLLRLGSVVARDYRLVDHLMFECRLIRQDGQVESHLGLNEVAVVAGGSLQLLSIDLDINGELVSTFSGDGVIISTPVGSTAHSLAAGGPILKQDLHAFVITPICPHALTDRPLVDSADCVYTLRAQNPVDGVMMVIDGQIRRPLRHGDIVEVRRADVTFRLARMARHSYYSTLRHKLGWAGQPHYGA